MFEENKKSLSSRSSLHIRDLLLEDCVLQIFLFSSDRPKSFDLKILTQHVWHDPCRRHMDSCFPFRKWTQIRWCFIWELVSCRIFLSWITIRMIVRQSIAVRRFTRLFKWRLKLTDRSLWSKDSDCFWHSSIRRCFSYITHHFWDERNEFLSVRVIPS